MDRGAARSRKRALKLAPTTDTTSSAGPSRPPPSKPLRPQADGDRKPIQDRPDRLSQIKKHRKQRQDNANTDPTKFQPKAIRTAAALIYSKEPFPIPPPKDLLSNVRRIDLEGSGVTDVSFLLGTGVTWLSLKGCEVENGWEAVGSLNELAVLNISDTGLTDLPEPLQSLSKLKALVAMNNPWTKLNDDIISGWTELNSLIISHSPNLTSIPPSLSTLVHLSKLTFSHCPKLMTASLPDLSPNPLLRDVKMNNLPLLTSLPSHIRSWGTGDLSSVKIHSTGGEASSTHNSNQRFGEGLEVLDIGNCSLPYEAISLFLPAQNAKSKSKAKTKTSESQSGSSSTWSNLRSLSLHSNPLCISHPTYSEDLQASDLLPKLQIIDAKRIVERKRKGEVSESREERLRRERRENKMKPSGANVGGGKMRSWGAEKDGEANVKSAGEALEADAETARTGSKNDKKRKHDTHVGNADGPDQNTAGNVRRGKDETKRKRDGEDILPAGDDHKTGFKKQRKDAESKTSNRPISKQAHNNEPKESRTRPAASTQAVPDGTSAATAATASTLDPSALAPAAKKPFKTETSVVGVVDVVAEKAKAGKGKKGKKGDDSTAGTKGEGHGGTVVDLREMFGKTSSVPDGGSGLGVGGW